MNETPKQSEERRWHERRDLPEFEQELDISKMSQEEINQFVVTQIIHMRRDMKPFLDTLKTGGLLAKWATSAAAFIVVVSGAYWAVAKIFHKLP